MIVCQACAHHPGIGRMCPVGHRHATAAPKHCDTFRPRRNTAVARLRAAAVELRQAGHERSYGHVLRLAHREAQR